MFNDCCLTISYNDRSFGSGFPNVKYFCDEMAASERIREMIIRVSDFGSNNMEEEILQQVYGKVICHTL